MLGPYISMKEDKSVFWVFLLQRKSYLVSFERLYHLYPFIYPKYKHNKSIKAEQIPYFSFFIEKRVSGHISSSNVTKFWTRKIWFDSKTGNFQFENDTFRIWIHIFVRKWAISVRQFRIRPEFRPQIDLEIDNKNRFPVWAKLRQNVRFSDNLT